MSIRSLGASLVSRYPRLLLYAPIPLISIAVELTNACNLRCRMCYSQNPRHITPRPHGFMDWTTYQKVIDEARRIPTVEYLGFNLGGESLLHPKFIPFLEYAGREDRFKIQFHTNGMLMSEEIARSVIDNGVNRITFSLDGTKEKNELIRVGANYDQIRDNILRLLVLRGGREKPTIAVNLVTSFHELEDIERFRDAWKNLVDEVLIYPELTEGGSVIPHPFFGDDCFVQPPFCKDLFTYLAVLWNGDVICCCRDIAGRNVIGNVHTRTLTEIFKGKKAVRMREDFINRASRPDVMCHSCDFRTVKKEVSDV